MSKMNKSLICLLMMVKNEEKRITVSFDSVKDFVDTFIILDTGSTDNTIPIMKEYCKNNNITLHLKEEPFVNFEVSRNVSLDFADEVIDKNKPKYLILLDCNDELKNGEILYKFVSEYKGPCHGFHLKQNWWNGSNSDTYYNMRFVKSHNQWRYKGVVHEYMMCPQLEKNKNDAKDIVMKIEGPTLFQDRTKDDDKSMKRFTRDKELLYGEYLKNPVEPRTLFYLGQTCGCLGHIQEAYKYYTLRVKQEGFLEEVYHSYYRLGELSMIMKHPWEESFNWFMKAFSHSQRVEPLIKIAEYYKTHNHKGEETPDFLTSYMYAHMACKLLFPFNQILFIDRRAYDYTRWHLLGIVAYYVGRYKEGKEACLKALEMENNEIDLKNLIWYMKKEREIKQKIDTKTIDLDFKHLISMSFNQNEISPNFDETKPVYKRVDILSKATVMLLEELKNNK